MKQTVARWESRSGKHYVDLYLNTLDSGLTYYGYESKGCMGTFEPVTEEVAVGRVQGMVDAGYFQPDRLLNPMKRVR
jgi:hypothetical protein